MWTVELHSHTCYSKDCLTRLDQVIEACKRKEIDRIAITDHNTAEGALRLQQMAPELVIVGEEVRTTHGEILAYFLTETVPPGLPPEEAIARIRAQGGVVGVSHPADRLRHEAMGLERLRPLLNRVDALEVFNARCLVPADNAAALAVAQEYNLLQFCGSDAHTVLELGTAANRLAPFHTPKEFLLSLRHGQMIRRYSLPFVHFASTYAKWYKRAATRKM